ncbi:SMI1/KNR4 family protein [Capsulimonas corticalis]|uniref:SMI1/KNR4 family protein n=1 Tax=Capsulimonas corticalis TaxID=2219043 RepID=UPI001403E2B2|nr:SMI1/KNR4 family protein [Capsulimonas corticalis]
MNQLELKAEATEEEIQKLVQYVRTLTNHSLPDDYLEFLRLSNGATGHGPDLFVNLPGGEGVAELTVGYGVAEYFPGLIIIGSDGCGNLIGVDLTTSSSQDCKYVLFDCIDLDREHPICVAETFVDLLKKI